MWLQPTNPLQNHFFFYFRGDNRYYLTTGINDSFHNLPPAEHYAALGQSWQTLCVSWLHCSETVFVNYRDWKWTKLQFLTSHAADHTLVRLSNFMRANGDEDVRVVFGEHGSYVAWTADSDDGVTLSEWKDEVICARMTPLIMGAKLEMVALGVDGAFFIKKRDGSVVWDLKGRYEALARALKMVPPNDVSFVALNPDRSEEFMLVLRKRIVVFCLPERMALEVRRRLETQKFTCVVLTGRDGEFAVPGEMSWEKLLDYTHAMVAIGSKCEIM